MDRRPAVHRTADHARHRRRYGRPRFPRDAFAPAFDEATQTCSFTSVALRACLWFGRCELRDPLYLYVRRQPLGARVAEGETSSSFAYNADAMAGSYAAVSGDAWRMTSFKIVGFDARRVRSPSSTRRTSSGFSPADHLGRLTCTMSSSPASEGSGRFSQSDGYVYTFVGDGTSSAGDGTSHIEGVLGLDGEHLLRFLGRLHQARVSCFGNPSNETITMLRLGGQDGLICRRPAAGTKRMMREASQNGAFPFGRYPWCRMAAIVRTVILAPIHEGKGMSTETLRSACARTDGEIALIANRMRHDIIAMLEAAGSGHPGGSLSAADIIATLYFSGVLASGSAGPARHAERDRFVLSQGTCRSRAVRGARQIGIPASRRACFPCASWAAACRAIRIATCAPASRWAPGGCGQGLSIAAGMALGLALDAVPPASSRAASSPSPATASCRRGRTGRPRCSPPIASSATSSFWSITTTCRSTAM